LGESDDGYASIHVHNRVLGVLFFSDEMTFASKPKTTHLEMMDGMNLCFI
jgi:hypothetical protein